MTSLSCLNKDLPKLLSVAEWLIEDGFSYSIDNEYIIKFKKGVVTIEVYYGRYSDPTDVFVTIDSSDSDRYDNNDPYKYSVFEIALVDPNIEKRSLIDGYSTAKIGLELLKNHQCFFDVQYLKINHLKYIKKICEKLPEHLRDLT